MQFQAVCARVRVLHAGVATWTNSCPDAAALAGAVVGECAAGRIAPQMDGLERVGIMGSSCLLGRKPDQLPGHSVRTTIPRPESAAGQMEIHGEILFGPGSRLWA